ncbi:long-chain-fatty-acid--CoA ligase [uncultured Sphingomonas sp.]|uniref:long-chain-fatty-acid--CoA ligase n=1 Tax=uncultured Sphingomonas sp. TaxID=158754 RepID=UPI0035C987F6
MSTASPGCADMIEMVETFDALLRHQAGARPAASAIQFETRVTDYATLDRQADAIAAVLSANALPSGARIVYLGRNSDRCLALLFGCARAGAVLTPVNWRLAPDELRHIVEDAEAVLVFVTREHAAVPATLGLPGVDVDDDEAWEAWLTGGAGSPLPSPPAAGDVLVQIYSSGTTGRPKGVELTHANMLASARHAATGVVGRWTAEDRMLVALPVFHVAALLCSSYALINGATIVLMREADLGGIQDLIRRQAITKTGLVPTLIQLLLDWPDFEASAFATLHLIIYGGSGIAPALLGRAFTALECDFLQLYGASETCAVATVLLPEDHRAGSNARLASCGRALPGVAVRVVDADGADAAMNEPGEVLIRSPGIMKGYWHCPDSTAEVMVDGWYRSGDIGSLDADGYLTIRDRLRDMIISGGENVYAIEVENALAAHPQIAECAVIGTPDAIWGEAVTAIVVARPGTMIEAEGVIAHARTLIAAYKCPRRVIFVDSLPKNAGGKILKAPLRERYAI